MSLSIDDVKRIAHLARIRVDADEAARYQAELNGILDLIEQMQAVDTAGIEPMAHARDVHQRLRADSVTEADRRETNLALAPLTEAGLFLVPQVIE